MASQETTAMYGDDYQRNAVPLDSHPNSNPLSNTHTPPPIPHNSSALPPNTAPVPTIATSTSNNIPLAIAAETAARAALIAVSDPKAPIPDVIKATAAASAAAAAAHAALVKHAPKSTRGVGKKIIGFFKRPMTYLKIILVLILFITGYQYSSYAKQAYDGSTEDDRKKGMKNLAMLSGMTKTISTAAAIGGFILLLGR